MGKASWAQQTYQGYHVSLDFLLFFSYWCYFPEPLLIPGQVSNRSRVSEKAGKTGTQFFFCTSITIDFKMPRDQVPLVLGCFASHTQ